MGRFFNKHEEVINTVTDDNNLDVSKHDIAAAEQDLNYAEQTEVFMYLAEETLSKSYGESLTTTTLGVFSTELKAKKYCSDCVEDDISEISESDRRRHFRCGATKISYNVKQMSLNPDRPLEVINKKLQENQGEATLVKYNLRKLVNSTEALNKVKKDRLSQLKENE